MEFAFYFASGIAVVSTLRVVTGTNPVHALLYLIISLISVAMIFFATGAPFAGATGDRLRRRHHGAVRVRGDDAQPRAGIGRPGNGAGSSPVSGPGL